jgi:predicted GIY-YIG superfamily endonuclease
MFYVYVLRSAAKRVKIGVARDIPQRMRQLQAEHGRLELFHYFACESSPESFRLEKALHWWFRREHLELEWFTEAVLDTIRGLDPRPVLKAYADTRMYEFRLDKHDVDALRKRGLDVEAAVKLALV